MRALKPYCTNTQPKRVARTVLPALTELRSLQIKVSFILHIIIIIIVVIIIIMPFIIIAR